MSVLTVRNLNAEVKSKLRIQAAEQGIAMEEAVRRILTRAANEPQAVAAVDTQLGLRIQARFAGLGEVKPPARRPMRGSPFADVA